MEPHDWVELQQIVPAWLLNQWFEVQTDISYFPKLAGTLYM